MALFGRKANPQPNGTDVPPELQPYYAPPARQGRWRRARLYILPLVALLLVVAAVIGGIFWLQHHSLNSLLGRSTPPAQTPATSQNEQQPAPTAPNPTPSGGSDTNQTPSSGPVPASPALPGDQTAPQVAQGAPAVSPAPSNAVPNTGPDGMTAVLAMCAAVCGAAALHLYQRRSRATR